MSRDHIIVLTTLSHFRFRFGPVLIGVFLNCILYGVSMRGSTLFSYAELKRENAGNDGTGAMSIKNLRVIH